MACGACARRRQKLLEERARRKAQGEKVVPALIGATVAAIDAVAKPLQQKETKR